MKKILALVFSIVGLTASNAQITITSADMPSPVKMYITSTDTLASAISVGNSDSMQTWNLTPLTAHTNDTSISINYNDHPNALFSSATSVMLQKGTNNFYGYTINSPSSFELIGGSGLVDVQGTIVNINQTYTPAEKIFNFPTSYDSSFMNDFTTSAKFYYGQIVQGFTIDSINSISHIIKDVHVDAYGTLTTPLGGPYNVLRVKEVKMEYDTLRAYFFQDWNDVPIAGAITADTTTTYYWWANGYGMPLATAVMSNDSTVKSVQWLSEIPSIPPVEAHATAVNASCQNQCDGMAMAAPIYGVAPYTYSWSTNPVQTTDTASGLCAGTYTVTITDSLANTSTAVVTIGVPAAPHITPNGVVLTASSGGTSYQWLLNDTVITGATAMTYTATQNGNYSVIVTTNGCIDTAAVVHVTNVGIAEVAINDNSIKLYPNPANSDITIVIDNVAIKQALQVEIRNELGQVVRRTELAVPEKLTIDINNLQKGVYFVNLKNSEISINKKIVKQ